MIQPFDLSIKRLPTIHRWLEGCRWSHRGICSDVPTLSSWKSQTSAGAGPDLMLHPKPEIEKAHGMVDGWMDGRKIKCLVNWKWD